MSPRSIARFRVSALACVLLGCGGTSATRPTGGDLAVRVDFAPGSDAGTEVDLFSPDMASCNALPVPPPITFTYSSDDAPAMTGGTIVAGTYILTAGTLYDFDPNTGSPLQPVAQIWEFGASTLDTNSNAAGGGVAESGTWTTSGASLSIEDKCGAPYTSPPYPIRFTATPMTLTITQDTGAITTYEILTKQ